MAESQSVVDLSGLQWVRTELDQNLERVNHFIEAYLESPEDKLPLQRSVIELHQARGILAMVRLHGAALLVEELRQAVHDVLHGVTDNIESVFEVVLGGAVQLTDYLDFIQAESKDSALIFHPLINELRVARGKPVVNESELFVRFLVLEPPEVELPFLGDRDQEAASRDAKSFQMHFQSALLGVLKDRETQSNLLRLTQICQQVLKGISQPLVYQQWLFAEAVLEALVDRGLDTSLDVKRLFGRMGMLLKYLASEGQDSPNAHDGEVAYALLYYVGRSTSKGEKVTAVRTACDLERLLPDIEQLEAVREKLRGPNTGLLQTLSMEIRSDIGAVKDNLDLLLRAGDKAPDRLDETVNTIKRIATTLDMLGMTALQRVVLRQAEIVDRRRHESEPDQTEWLDAAVSLLWVEHSLDELLFRHVHPDAVQGDAPGEEPGTDSISPLELREGAASILREALVNIAHIKELTNSLLMSYQAESVDEIAHLLHEMSSGLVVIGVESTDTAIVQRLREYVQNPAFRFIGSNEELVGKFADAVSALEFYLLALQAKQNNTHDLLEKCNVYIEGLRLPAIPADFEESPADIPSETADDVEVVQPEVPVVNEEVDPEIREIFMEEVEEIRENLAVQVPQWTHNVDDSNVLGDIRRAFHTLKGSGRMAGANAIGDYGWSIEQLLNSCLDGSLSVDHAVTTLVKNATEHLGELVVAYKESLALPASARQIILEAHRLTNTEPPANVVAAVQPQSQEEDLWTIFGKDAAQHIANLKSFLEVSGHEFKPQLVTPELVRAFHTMKSGSRIVGANEMSHLAAEMEALADAVRSTGRNLSTEQIELISTVTDGLDQALAVKGDISKISANLNQLAERAQKFVASLPDEAGATDRELMVIFTDEACDRLDNIDASLQDWKEATDDVHHPQIIIRHCDALAESANTAKVAPLAMVAQEMRRLVNDWQEGGVSPSLIESLGQILISIYDMLDRLRHGAQIEQAGELLSQLQHLSEQDHEPQVEESENLASGPEVQTTFEDQVTESTSEVIDKGISFEDFLDANQPLNVTEPVESTSDQSAEAAEEAISEPVQAEVVSEHMDEELLALFVEEGEEILEAVGHELDRWEENPDNPASLIELMRLLHTLKGSAHMAGANNIGDLSHGLEDQLTDLAREGNTASPEFFGKLRIESDAIHDALENYRLGKSASAVQVVDEQVVEPAQPEVIQESAIYRDDVQASEINYDFQTQETEPSPTLTEPVTAGLSETVSGDDAFSPEIDLSGASEPEIEESSGFAPEPEPEPEIVSEPEFESASGPEPIPEPEFISEPDQKPLATPKPAPEPETPPVAAVLENPAHAEVQGKPADVRPEPSRAAATAETARVSMTQLDRMFNEAGEVGINLGRMEKQQTDLKIHLKEMSQSIAQIRDRLRLLDIEAEQQMQAGRELRNANMDEDRYEESFDPLEMDRYTRMNELSRSLNESAADLVSLQTLMEEVNSSNETLLLQQGRITSNLQHGLMNTMLVPFSGLVQRLQRIARQTATANSKQVRLEFEGAENELDRNVLERMVGPLEHLLRNAVIHGIETPDDRQLAAKDREGRIRVSLRRDGTQSIIEVKDDGRGLDLASIRRTGIEKHLIAADAELDDQELVQMIFEPGFSTASKLTHEAGRGVGMDVVSAEIKQLGGSLNVSFVAGQGTQFVIRIPSSLALTNALLVRVGHESFAISMSGIDGIERLPRTELPRYFAEDGPQVLYGGNSYPALRLADLINATVHESEEEESKNVPVLLIHSGETRFALVVDQVLGGEELIVKSLGPQVSAIPGVSGGTILADGGVVLIIDVATLYQTRHRKVLSVSAPLDQVTRVKDERPLILIVDDSITIRRVTERFLSRHGFRIDTAKDGMDALPKLQSERPDAVLLDVEMPRIDGFEVATYMRNNEGLHDVPILMITSRSGEKHRQRAAEIGVDRYLIKPYQEDELLSNLEAVLHANKVH